MSLVRVRNIIDEIDVNKLVLETEYHMSGMDLKHDVWLDLVQLTDARCSLSTGYTLWHHYYWFAQKYFFANFCIDNKINRTIRFR